MRSDTLGHPAEIAVRLPPEALDAAMPLSLLLDEDGRIRRVAPVLRRILGDRMRPGDPLDAVFEVLRPRTVDVPAGLAARPNQALRLRLRKPPTTAFKGQVVPCGDSMFLLNLALGFPFVTAIEDYRLTLADFAPTDMTIDLLYMMEANAAAMSASRDMNRRLQVAKVAAEEQAYTDTLTGLKNRRALDHVLARTIEAGQPFGLMVIDLDYFKSVNDQLGHAAGDHVLMITAQRILSLSRSDDLVARVGGDEFVLLFHALTDTVLLNSIAARLIARIEQPITYEGAPCRISASVGITASPHYDRPDGATMLNDADAALYAAKRMGRARFTVHDGPASP